MNAIEKNNEFTFFINDGNVALKYSIHCDVYISVILFIDWCNGSFSIELHKEQLKQFADFLIKGSETSELCEEADEIDLQLNENKQMLISQREHSAEVCLIIDEHNTRLMLYPILKEDLKNLGLFLNKMNCN